MFKDEIIKEMKNQLKDITVDNIKVYHSDYVNTLALIAYSKDFEYIYCGSGLMVRWLKGKALYEKINSNRTFRDLYMIAFNCVENRLDIDKQLQIAL